MGKKTAWTLERRARQADIIQRTRPWEKSTGPRTEEGKRISSQNARMKPIQELGHIIRAHGIAQRKILRIARKLHGGSLNFLEGGQMFPGATREQVREIADLDAEIDDLTSRVFSLFPDYTSPEDDLHALANLLHQHDELQERPADPQSTQTEAASDRNDEENGQQVSCITGRENMSQL